VPGSLATQYPTVFGGLIVAPATPGETPVQINSHFIVLETVRDPALEAEVTSAYPPGLSVEFKLTPYSLTCLHDVNSQLATMMSAIQKGGISVISVGVGATHVVVGVTDCKPDGENAAKRWFAQRWGNVVQVQTCQTVPTAQ
jgi:hypothetical protein